jgi:hypothetical protein
VDALPSTSGASRALDVGDRVGERTAVDDGVDAGGVRGGVAWDEHRPEHARDATLVARAQEERRASRPSVEQEQRLRLDDTAEIVELVALTERLLARPVGGAFEHRDRVADALEDGGAPRGELLRREDRADDGLRREWHRDEREGDKTDETQAHGRQSRSARAERQSTAINGNSRHVYSLNCR